MEVLATSNLRLHPKLFNLEFLWSFRRHPSTFRWLCSLLFLQTILPRPKSSIILLKNKKEKKKKKTNFSDIWAAFNSKRQFRWCGRVHHFQLDLQRIVKDFNWILRHCNRINWNQFIWGFFKNNPHSIRNVKHPISSVDVVDFTIFVKDISIVTRQFISDFKRKNFTVSKLAMNLQMMEPRLLPHLLDHHNEPSKNPNKSWDISIKTYQFI